MDMEKRRGAQGDDFGTGNISVTNKYNAKSRSGRKKKGRKVYEKNVRGRQGARFKADEGQQPGATDPKFTSPGANPGDQGNESWASTLSEEERNGGDTVSPLMSLNTPKAMEPGQHPVGAKRTSYRISVNSGDEQP